MQMLTRDELKEELGESPSLLNTSLETGKDT